MSKQVQDAYIVAATRTPIGKSGRGYFKNTRPDDLLVAAVKSAMMQVPSLDPKAIEDAIIGCSFPEAERQGRLRLVASPDGQDGSLTVQQDVRVFLSSLSEGQQVSHQLERGRFAWLQVLRGSVQLNGLDLSAGDGVAVRSTAAAMPRWR